jgi:hypothetical protein
MLIPLAILLAVTVTSSCSGDLRVGDDPDDIIDTVRWLDGDEARSIRQGPGEPDQRIRLDLSTPRHIVLDVWGGDPPPVVTVSTEGRPEALMLHIKLDQPSGGVNDIGIYHLLDVRTSVDVAVSNVSLEVTDNSQ